MVYTYFYETEIGKIGISVKNEAVIRVFFENMDSDPDAVVKETNVAKECANQIREYLQGSRLVFNLPLAPEGTVFQQKVWEQLQLIPYGETRTYGQIANAIGCPGGSRAVGLANNRNPIAIVIPCHRVIGADGKLVGYGGGLPLKEKLLQQEASHKNG